MLEPGLSMVSNTLKLHPVKPLDSSLSKLFKLGCQFRRMQIEISDSADA